jgi:hypothetical protein
MNKNKIAKIGMKRFIDIDEYNKLEKENKELHTKGEELCRVLGNLMVAINDECKCNIKEKIKDLRQYFKDKK